MLPSQLIAGIHLDWDGSSNNRSSTDGVTMVSASSSGGPIKFGAMASICFQNLDINGSYDNQTNIYTSRRNETVKPPRRSEADSADWYSPVAWCSMISLRTPPGGWTRKWPSTCKELQPRRCLRKLPNVHPEERSQQWIRRRRNWCQWPLRPVLTGALSWS